MSPSAHISKSPSKFVATPSHTKTTTTAVSSTPSSSKYKAAESGSGATPSSTTTVKKTLPGSSGAPASSSSQPSSPSTASTSQSSPYQPPRKTIRPSVKAAARRKAATPSSVASSPQPSIRRSTRASGPKGPFVRLATPSTDHRVQIQEQKSPKSTRESRERAASRTGSRPTTRTTSTTAASESESSDSESESDSGKSTPEPLSISAVIPGLETKNTKTKKEESKAKDTDVEMTGPSESVSTAPKPSSATRKATPPTLTSSIHPPPPTEPSSTKPAAGDGETKDGEKPWLHPSELPYIQRSDWTQDATITYLVQNVFSIPKRIKGGKIAQTQREKGGMAGSMSFVRVESGFPSDSGTTTVGGVVGGTMEGTPPLEGGATSTNATATSKSTSTQASTTNATTTRVTYLPRGYRIPLMFVAKFQWESLRLVLTSERPEGEWDEFKYDIVHLSRLCSHLLKDAQAAAALPPIDDGAGEWTKEGDVEVRSSAGKGGYKDERIGQMTKQWRCPMFDRALTRFFRKWMICREWSVKYFWEEYGEEEYEFDVLKHDWARWVLKGHKGFLLTKDEVELGISADQFLAGLDRITDSNGQGRWVWDNERYVGARGLAVTGGSTNNSMNNTPKGTPSGRRRANQKKDGGKEKGKDKGGDGDGGMDDGVKVKKEMIEANLSRDPSEYSSMLSASVPPTPTESAPSTKTAKVAASSTTAPTVANAKNASPPSPQHTSTLPPRFAASKSSTSLAAKPTNTTSTTKATAGDAVNASNTRKTPSVLAKPNPPPAASSGSSAKTTTGGDRTTHKVVSPALTTAKTNTPTIPTLKPGMVSNTTISVTNLKKRAREEEEVAVSKRAKATNTPGADADADGKAVEVEKGVKEKGTEKAKEKGKEKEKGGDAMDVDQPESSVTKKAPSLPAKPVPATSPSTTKAAGTASSLKRTANSRPPLTTPSMSAAPVTSPTTSNASPNAPANANPTLAAVASGSTGSSAQSKSSEGVASSGSASAPYPASLSAPKADMGLMTWKRPIDVFSLNRSMGLPTWMGTTIPKPTPARHHPVPSVMTTTHVSPAPLVTGRPPWRASVPSSAVPPPSDTTPATSSAPASAPASESSSVPSASSASPIPSSTASDPNVSPYLKFVKDLSSAIDTRLDGAVEKIVEEVRKIERDAGTHTPTAENGKAKQPQQPPALASPPEMKQALEALLGLLEFNTKLRELVVSGNERALAEIGSLVKGQQKASEQGQKVEAVVEATWGVVNYVETLLREAKDLQKDMGIAHSAEVAKGAGRDKAIGELSAKLDGLERVVGEFRAESVARAQEAEGRAARAELESEHRDNALSKQVDALKGALEKVEQRRLEAEDRAEEIDTLREEAQKRRDQLRNEEAKKIHEDMREGIAVARESRKAVEELKGEIRMRNAVGVNANVQGKERVTVAKIVSDVAIQVEPVDVEMGDAPAERRRKDILSSKAKKALDVVQHMADLPGFSYPLDDDADDIQSSDDGVVAIRTRAVSTKGKEREVARPPASARNAAAQDHSESTMLALLLDEFRLIKDKLNAMERRSREEVASTKLLHSAELDTLRSEMERRDEDDRRRRELEARLERERLDREMQRLDRLERERCEIREREARERRELVERLERLERERAEPVGESERERRPSAWTEENAVSSSSRSYRDHLHGYDLDAENAELRRRLAFYELRPSQQPYAPHPPHRESSSGSLSNSGIPHRDLSEPSYLADPPRRDRSSSIASSSNNVESARRPPMINTNVSGSSMMDVDGAGASVSVPAKAQRKMMRRDHGHMLPPSGEP